MTRFSLFLNKHVCVCQFWMVKSSNPDRKGEMQKSLKLEDGNERKEERAKACQNPLCLFGWFEQAKR